MCSNRTFVPDKHTNRWAWLETAGGLFAMFALIGAIFGGGYVAGQLADTARWTKLVERQDKIDQRIALMHAVQVRLLREAADRHGGVLEASNSDVYYHTNADETITVHTGGPWGADCKHLRGQEPLVVQRDDPPMFDETWQALPSGATFVRFQDGTVQDSHMPHTSPIR